MLIVSLHDDISLQIYKFSFYFIVSGYSLLNYVNLINSLTVLCQHYFFPNKGKSSQSNEDVTVYISAIFEHLTT